MQALGVFGEYYYQINDDMNLTIGARWADETKDLDTIDASYLTAVDYAGIPYSAATFNVGKALRDDGTVAADQAFLVDYAVHNGVLNFDVLHSTAVINPVTGATMKQTLMSGAASGAAIVKSTREAIDREEARNGVDYDAAINLATKNYVTAYHTTLDAVSASDSARDTVGGQTYLAVLGKAINAASTDEKAAADSTFAQIANVAT